MKTPDRRQICAVRLDGGRKPTRVVRFDPGPQGHRHGRFGVARLSSGVILVTGS